MTDETRPREGVAASGAEQSPSQPRVEQQAQSSEEPQLEPQGPPQSQAAPQAQAQAQAGAGAEAVEVVSEASVSLRRAPRYQRFLVLGAGLGAVVTFILTNLYPTDESVGFGPLLGFMLLIGVPAGAALGGIVAIVLDAIATRRAKQYRAEHTTVDSPPEVVEGELEE